MNNKLKENFIYNVTYQIIALLVPLITMPYISRVLGAKGIGYYAYSFSVVSLAVSFAVLGGDAHGNRCIARAGENKVERSKVFLSIFIIQIITTIISCIFYFVYVAGSEIYKSYLLLQSLHLFAALFNVNWYFYGQGKFKIMVIRNIVIKILTLISIFLFVKYPEDTYKYILILGIGDLLSVMVVWPYILKNIVFVRINSSDIQKNIKPMLLLFIPIISMTLYKKMDRVMLGTFSTVVQNGYYENIDKIISVPSSIISAIGLVMLPQISNMLVNENKNKTIALINRMMSFIGFISCGMCFGVAAIAEEFVPLFFGDEFISCIKLMIFISPVIVFQGYSNMLRSAYLIPYQLDKVYIISTISGAIVNLVINLFLIKKYGALGAVIGTVFAELTVVFIQFSYVRSELPIKKYIIELVSYIFIGSFMWISIRYISSIMFFSNIIKLIIEILIGGILFIFTSYLYYKYFKIKDVIS